MHPDVLDVDQDPAGAGLDVLYASRSGESLASVWLVWAGRLAALLHLPLTCPGNLLARPPGRVNLYPAG